MDPYIKKAAIALDLISLFLFLICLKVLGVIDWALTLARASGS
jgi:hypothetical protein